MTTRTRLWDRSVGDIIVLLIAITVCGGIIVAIISIAILEFIDSTVDTSRVVALLSDTINTLIGVMAGFLVGKTAEKQRNGNGSTDK